jgi:glutaredoxin
MSELRRKRKEERENPQPTGRALRKILIVAGVLIVAFGIYYFAYHRKAHKLDAFAECLSKKQLKMYGAYWCPHCAEQKEKFDASFEYVPYIECGVPGERRAETQQCLQAGVKQFPTWVFPDGTREARVFELEELSQKSTCPLP